MNSLSRNVIDSDRAQLEADIQAWRKMQERLSHSVTPLDTDTLRDLHLRGLLFFTRARSGNISGSFYKRPLDFSSRLFRWGGFLTDGSLSGARQILELYRLQTEAAISDGEQGIGKTSHLGWARCHSRMGWTISSFEDCMGDSVKRTALTAYIQTSPKGWVYYQNGNFKYTLLGFE